MWFLMLMRSVSLMQASDLSFYLVFFWHEIFISTLYLFVVLKFECQFWELIAFFLNWSLLIDWLIYSFVVLTPNMPTPCGSIYWCLYRKTLRGKKTHIFRPSSIAFRSSFETFWHISTWCLSSLVLLYFDMSL